MCGRMCGRMNKGKRELEVVREREREKIKDSKRRYMGRVSGITGREDEGMKRDGWMDG